MNGLMQMEEETTEIEQDAFGDLGSLDAEKAQSVDAEGLSEEIESMAESFDVTGFKCTECGLVHGDNSVHGTDKHRLVDSFDVTHEEVADMPMGGNCHCGLNFIAHYGEEYGIEDAPSPESAASTAPIPESTKSKIRNLR